METQVVEQQVVVGIDIAKAKFDVTILSAAGTTRHHQFQNNVAGFGELHRWLQKYAPTGKRVGMEATGAYWEDLATFLHERGYRVSVINPSRIHAFGQSQLRRTKNDRHDALLIAQFCQSQNPETWQPLTPAQQELRALTRHLDDLEGTLRQQQNRLESARIDVIRQSLQKVIGDLETEIEDIRRRIQSLTRQDVGLKEKIARVDSITGIGELTATRVIAEMPNLGEYKTAKQVTAQAGLSPRQFQSGSSVNGQPRLCKIGNARIRKALYFPAIVAMKHNPILKELKERLEARGKSKMCIIGAVMRKLLHLIYGVLKNNQDFDPEYLKNSNNQNFKQNPLKNA